MKVKMFNMIHVVNCGDLESQNEIEEVINKLELFDKIILTTSNLEFNEKELKRIGIFNTPIRLEKEENYESIGLYFKVYKYNESDTCELVKDTSISIDPNCVYFIEILENNIISIKTYSANDCTLKFEVISPSDINTVLNSVK